MSTTQVSLMQATVTKDEATNLTVIEMCLSALVGLITNGNLAVNASGVTLTADLIDLDVQAITGAGAAAKSLADVVGALDAPAQQGGVGVPQADAVTSGAGWLAAVTIPAGTNFIDFLLDVAAYVVADATSGAPSNNGVPYQPHLNFRIPCTGATKLHLRRVGGSDATMKWNAIA